MTSPLTFQPGEQPGAFVRDPGDDIKFSIPVRYVVPLDTDLAARPTGPGFAPVEYVDYPGDRGHGISHGHRAHWDAAGSGPAYDIGGYGIALEDGGPVVAIWPAFDAWRWEPSQPLTVVFWFAEFAAAIDLTDAGRRLVEHRPTSVSVDVVTAVGGTPVAGGSGGSGA